MHIKKLYIFLLLFISVPVSAQIPQDKGYKLTYPENISANSSFDISLVASNPYNDADVLELYFIPSPRIIFKNLTLRSVYNETNIPCSRIYIDGISGTIYRADIDLAENKLSPKTYFQLLFNFKADNAKNANFSFSGMFKTIGETVGYIQNADKFYPDDTLKFSSVSFKVL